MSADVPTTAEIATHIRAGKLVEARGVDVVAGKVRMSDTWRAALICLRDVEGPDAGPADQPQPTFRLVDAPGPAFQADRGAW